MIGDDLERFAIVVTGLLVGLALLALLALPLVT